MYVCERVRVCLSEGVVLFASIRVYTPAVPSNPPRLSLEVRR